MGRQGPVGGPSWASRKHQCRLAAGASHHTVSAAVHHRTAGCLAVRCLACRPRWPWPQLPLTREAHHRGLVEARGAVLLRNDGLLVGANHHLHRQLAAVRVVQHAALQGQAHILQRKGGGGAAAWASGARHYKMVERKLPSRSGQPGEKTCQPSCRSTAGPEMQAGRRSTMQGGRQRAAAHLQRAVALGVHAEPGLRAGGALLIDPAVELLRGGQATAEGTGAARVKMLCTG